MSDTETPEVRAAKAPPVAPDAASVGAVLKAARASFAANGPADLPGQFVAHLESALTAAGITATVVSTSLPHDAQFGVLRAVVTVGGESYGAGVP